ncbi:ZINC FINGER CCCH DOMAIN-CONTAINING PROTEIN 19 [Salix purpurea]|uniref:ZINC FINGER CCCH DOMAIN-CONTAINING PROTEIN 19 n=1 Tax=Salix purpurea TaxID=77065 RepID=A0A9Q0PR11_SALPP|nr:ZINC FINGER CCCH DOMAIN-CONTAINING PROTEIN 19 [Salix purpurea]
MEAVELIEMNEIVEEENVDKMEANEVEKQPARQVEMTDIAEETREDEKNEMTDIAEETREDEKNEMTDIEEMKVAEHIETTGVAGGTEQAINEEGEMKETEITDVEEECDKEEDMELENVEKENEAEDMDEMEGAEEEVEEVGRSGGGGKRKRQKNAKAPSRATSKKKTEEDVCFICFDGGELVLCDRRGCPKAYHPSCVNRDEAFFRSKGRWNCALRKNKATYSD